MKKLLRKNQICKSIIRNINTNKSKSVILQSFLLSIILTVTLNVIRKFSSNDFGSQRNMYVKILTLMLIRTGVYEILKQNYSKEKLN